MRIHYPKLRNMTHALSLSVFIAFEGSNFSIFIFLNRSLLVINFISNDPSCKILSVFHIIIQNLITSDPWPQRSPKYTAIEN